MVFALSTGYAAVYTNPAFIAWNLFGNSTGGKWDKRLPLWKNVLAFLQDFNVLYAGAAIIAAVTAFHSPLTFLVLAFAPERAAHWTERLLTRLLPKSEPAPASGLAPSRASDESAEALSYPFWRNTALTIVTMAAMGYGIGAAVFGMASLLKNLGVAAAISGLSFWFSNAIIKAVMHDTPADEARDPEFFAVMRDLLGRINVERAAKGLKPLPMPEMVDDPMPMPNAYATGRSPFHATVGVTAGIQEMLLDPENTRESLVRLINASDASGASFKVFRRAIAGSIAGVDENSSPRETAQALVRADAADIKKLGVRMLRGVLGHEFSHVRDYHMLSGAITGAISSGVSFASYSVLWAVGRVKDKLAKLAKLAGRKMAAEREAAGPSSGVKPKTLEPISTGIMIKSLPALLKAFAALWGPVVFQLAQMSGSRNNEGQADRDGANLTQDPESLALALGMLMTWRPPKGFSFKAERIPRLAAVAHLFTVNPLEQLDRAGVLPRAEAVAAGVVGAEDEFISNLFMTHPDTVARIETLNKVSEAMHRQ